MKIEAVLFDLYETVLHVIPRDDDLENPWQDLKADYGLKKLPLSHREFSERCLQEIEASHQEAKQRGVLFPEIFWPRIVKRSLGSAIISWADCLRFSTECMGLSREVTLAPGAAAVLKRLQQKKRQLGIVSNAQPYTVIELEAALQDEGLGLDIFNPSLCFFSFQHGFSKPNPHVFQIMDSGLALLGVWPENVLMVGDRLDNDIEPARRVGWKTWQMGGKRGDGGSWEELLAFLGRK